MSKDIYSVVVKKPWGEEFCVFRGNNLSIWLLRIAPTQQTSLHCHPKKKTGLVVLDGIAQVSLLERSFPLTALAKINLRNLIFHQTKNTSDTEQLYVLEVETPDDKMDLVRIGDSYGRTNEAFEPESEWYPHPTLTQWTIRRDRPVSLRSVSFEVTTLQEILHRNIKGSVSVVLDAFAFLAKDKIPICECGDVVNSETLQTLSTQFAPVLSAEMIHICKLS